MPDRIRAAVRAGRRFRRLSSAERRLLLQALLALPLVALGLRRLGFRRVHNLLRQADRSPGRERDQGAPGRGESCIRPYGTGDAGPQLEAHPRDETAAAGWAQVVAEMVQAAAERGPYRATCLERSLVLWWLLLRAGIASELVIGVRKDGDAPAAHAWVEYRGRPLNDAPDVAVRFAPFPAPITSRFT